jgi:hypothetical protein
VGFPIRKSMDQSPFAAPHGLSQRTTSFIASQRQGIHRMLLRHLIVLMNDTPGPRPGVSSRKTSLLRTHAEPVRSGTAARATHPGCPVRVLHAFPLHDVKLSGTVARPARTPWRGPQSPASRETALSGCLMPPLWWSQTGSNRRPHACKARALPTELWPLVRQ